MIFIIHITPNDFINIMRFAIISFNRFAIELYKEINPEDNFMKKIK